MACKEAVSYTHLDVYKRQVYACIMYILVDMVFTAVDIPFWSMPAAMTSNPKERSGIIGTTQTVSSAISGIVGTVMPLSLIHIFF